MEKFLSKKTKYAKLFFGILALLLVFQLFRIQVIQHEHWNARSQKSQFRTTYQATRGSVYFGDGSPLAVSELAYSLFVLPQNFKSANIDFSKKDFASDFEKIIGVKADYVMQALESDLYYVAVARKIKPEIVAELEQKYPKSQGLWNSEQQFVRIYPNGTLASKIIGFVRSNDDGEEIGQYGIEQYFDGVLRGADGVFNGLQANGDIIASEDFESIISKNGIDITLTIDRNIQAYLEEKLMKWLDISLSKEVSAVVMEVDTGRIIAMANVPTYDPNKYWEGESVDCTYNYYNILHKKCNEDKLKKDIDGDGIVTTEESNNDIIYPDGYLSQLQQIELEQKKLEEEKKKLEESLNNINQEESKEPEYTDEEIEKLSKYPKRVWELFRRDNISASDVYRNSAVSALYEPGSVIKVMTLATVYNFNAISKDPEYQLGSHKGCEDVVDVVLCTASRQAVKSLSVKEMLMNSDNIGAFRIAQKIPAKDFAETFERFGLGKTSGIELADEPFFRTKDASTWTKVDLSTGAFGQGSVSFTPTQMTAAWNVLASKGKYFKPTIVKSINDNGEIKEFEPEFVRDVITAEAARDALDVGALAIKDTTPRANELYKKYPFVGKTATANIPKTNGVGYEENALNMGYIGIAPLDNPKFTMFIWFTEPQLSETGTPANSLNVPQYAWLDIAEGLMIKLNIAPKN